MKIVFLKFCSQKMCFDIQGVYTHPSSHSIDTGGEHNLFKQLISSFPFVFVFFIHASGTNNCFPAFRFSGMSRERGPETKTGRLLLKLPLTSRGALNHKLHKNPFRLMKEGFKNSCKQICFSLTFYWRR